MAHHEFSSLADLEEREGTTMPKDKQTGAGGEKEPERTAKNVPRNGSDKSPDPREQAEKRLGGRFPKAEDIPTQTREDIVRLVHELRVHEIELEMQNEELRLAQARLKELKGKYVDLYDFAPVGYVTMDRHGKITEANLTLGVLLGVGRASLPGRRFSEFVSLTDHTTYYSHWLLLKETGTLQSCEITLMKDGGSPFNARLQSVSSHDSDGEWIGCRTMVSDITDRKRAEEALRESEEKYRLIFSKERDAIVLTDAETFEFLDVNEAAEKLWGYAREELLGTKAVEMSAEPEKTRAAMQEGTAPQGNYADFRWHKKKDGTIFPVEISSGPFTWKGRRVVCSILRDISERFKAEDALRIERERLLSIFDGIEAVVQVLDLETYEILYVNKFTKNLYGKELIGGLCYEVLHGLPSPCDHCPKEKVLSLEGEPYQWDYHNFTTNRDYLATDKQITWSDGRAAKFHFAIDITERKQAEEALRENERRYRTLFERARDAIMIIDLEGDNMGRIVDANPVAAKMHGYEMEELLAVKIDDLDTPESAKKIPERRERILKGEWLRGEAAHRRKDGSVFPIEISASLVEIGTHKYVLAMDRDITLRKQAEVALRASEQMLRGILAVSPVGMGLSHERKMVWVNDAWARMFGSAHPSEWMGQEARVLYESDEDFTRAGNLLYRNLESGLVNEIDVKMKRKDGSSFDANIRMTALDPGNLRAGHLAVITDISERKSAERALEKSEAMLNGILQAAQIGIGIVTDRQIGWTNRMISEMTGFSAGELKGKSATVLYASEDEFARVGEVKYKDIREKGIGQIETKWKRKDGQIIDVFLSSVPTVPGDLSKGVVFTALDITDRKQGEEALRTSEERLELAVRGADLGLWDLDVKSGKAVVNDRAMEMIGYERDELAPSVSLLDRLLHPNDRERVLLAMNAHLNGETPSIEEEYRFLTKTGEWKWVLSRGKVVERDRDGNAIRMTGTFLDITQRKKSELALRRLATAVEQAEEAIVITDLSGTIQYVNPAFEKITGYTRDEALGQNPRILKSGEHGEEFYKDLWSTVAQGKVWKGRVVNRRKDGTLYHEDATISPVRDRSGKIVNFVAVKRDVTTELVLQQQLLHAQKMEALGTLAGGIAHDFNNILQVTLGFSELLLSEKREDDPDHADLQKIHQAGRSGAELVKRLLTLSRKVDLKTAPMDLNAQIRNTEKLLRRTIPRMVDIRLELAEDLKRINADPGQIEQIIMNLAVNARDAMPEGGTLTLVTRNAVVDQAYCRLQPEAVPGDHVLLSVSDTGHGMERDILEHIFEPFFTTKELGRGTGLGLSMVYGIVRQHGGHIVCHSQMGRGTTFNVFLPVIADDPELETEIPGEILAFGTETVLLVDDEDMVRELGERILSRSGYTVLTAPNGEEALDLYRRRKQEISLVILDLIMPAMGGRECLKELVRIDPHAKVLIASGYAADVTAGDCAELGARGFVGKPFRFNELLKHVRRTLDEG